MNIPLPIFIGYFPKIIAQRDEIKGKPGHIWLKNDDVEEICSVSDFFSKVPQDWINQWKHNDLGFYNTEEVALSVIPEDGDSKKYELFGYKLYPIKFDKGESIDCPVEVKVEENLSAYEMIGFDVVPKSISDFFECSALSCSNGCEIFPVNKFCLIEDFEKAFQCCKRISEELIGAQMIERPDGLLEWRGKWEPGPYYIFQVFREKNKYEPGIYNQ